MQDGKATDNNAGPLANNVNNHNEPNHQEQHEEASPRARDGDQSKNASTLRHRGTTASTSTPRQKSPDYRQQREELKARLSEQRKRITLLRAPLTTLKHFAYVIWGLIDEVIVFLGYHQKTFYTLLATITILVIAHLIPGNHHTILEMIRGDIYFVGYWIILGVLSSIGFGFGLHTFLLYLQPHIVLTALAAANCKSVDFATRGPRVFLCEGVIPDEPTYTTFDIYLKVALPSFLWGLGTAIGELPPYFMARAARKAGQRLSELEELKEVPETTMEKAKRKIYIMLQNYGFIAIMLFASIPNPLFDLAGVTCGHFLIPFWTFFGATFFGKAIIKANMQASVVVLLFQETTLNAILHAIGKVVPWLQVSLENFFNAQRERLKNPTEVPKHLLAQIFEGVLIFMLILFVKAMIEACVQERLATIDQRIIEQNEERDKVASRPPVRLVAS